MPQALTITRTPGAPGTVYYPLHLSTVPTPTLSNSNQIIIKILCAALNHRDLFIRQHLYPGTTFAPVPLLADGCGVVVSAGADPAAQSWLGKRVVVNPGTGWKEDPDGPEQEEGGGGGEYRILGGTTLNPNGTGQEYMVVEAGEVEEAPPHLGDAEAAALPLTGLTAWRALVGKVGRRRLGEGRRLLVTGIGGGVALMALMFAKEMGTEVWVTSGSEEKIERAVKLGARGGVDYHEAGWERKLLALVKEGGNNGGKRTALFDAIIDGAGGDIVEKGAKILKVSSSTSSYISATPVTDPSSLLPPARRRDSLLRHDPRPQDGVPHPSGAEKHRAQGLHHGIAERVRRDDRVRATERDQAHHLPHRAGSGGPGGHRWPV